MSATNGLWMDEVDRACEQFAAEQLTREQALTKLSRLGFPNGEAEILLDEAVS